MAWLSDWAKRVKLTIDQGDIDAVLANFPILVHLGTSVGRNGDDVSCVFDELENDANRKKIAITTSDGQTQCYAEIEKWDDANEQAWLWVKVPSVASGADTDLYLYYDKTKADNTDYVGDPNSTPAENVWDSNFKLVCHMRDDPDISHVRDSTSFNNDGTKVAANEPIEADGKIGKAQDFDGTDDYISIPDSTPLRLQGDFTIEFWMNPHTTDGLDTILHKSDITYANYLVYRIYDGIYFYASADGSTWGTAAGTTGYLVAGTWSHIVITKTATSCRVYANTVFRGEDTTPVVPAASTDPLEIGEPRSVGEPFYNGIIDEPRISNTARSAAWIKASYESERDHLLDFGSEELSPGFVAAYTKFNRGFN